MLDGQPPEAIDTRLVFRVYAWIVAAGGATAFTLAAVMARGRSSGTAAMLGLIGAFSIPLVAYATAFARVADPAARLDGLKAFSVAHAAVGAFLWAMAEWTQNVASATVSSPLAAFLLLGPYRLLASNLFITGAVLLYLAYTASPGPRFASTMRSATPSPGGRVQTLALREKEGFASTRRLRSQFEEQIRGAARQEERARLARDLHDAVKQQLFVVQTAAATVQARFDADRAGAKHALEQVRTAAREAMTEMEAMLDQLQAAPIENTGLIEALKKQAEALRFRTGAAVTLDLEPLPPSRLVPPGAQQAIFRVAQEAFANVARHARARHVTVRLGMRDGSLAFEVADDGAGFDPLDGGAGMGIRNMQSRAQDVSGRFDLTSGPGTGTIVTFTVPLAARPPRSYLLMAGGFAAALVVCTALVASGGGSLRTWWIGAGWIALIGTVRYAVAFARVQRAFRETA